MANIKTYNQNMSIPGLPDTTNIHDDQLRLYLDRLNNSFNIVCKVVNELQNNSDIKNIIAELRKSPEFLDIIKNEAETAAETVISGSGSNYSQNNKVLLSIIVSPSVVRTTRQGNSSLDVIYDPESILDYQKGVTWSSSDEAVATVDGNGNITPVANGECVISAVSRYNSNITADCLVFVSDDITVNAAYRWVDVSGNPVYTEDAEPAQNDFVWDTNEEITVTVNDGMTEEEAKQEASAGTISAVDSRSFIISETNKVYWRDTENDVAEEYSTIGCWQAYILGDSSYSHPDLYGTLWGDWIGVKELFSKAYRADILGDVENATEEQKAEYSYRNCLIGENIPFAADPYPQYIYGDAHYRILDYKERDNEEDDWNDLFAGERSVYMISTGESVTLSYVDESGENVSEKWIKITTYDGRFPCWIKEEIWLNGGGGSYTACSTYKPYIEVDEYGSEYVHSGIDRDGHATINPFSWATKHVFKHNNIWYELTGYIYYQPYIFVPSGYEAWSTIPYQTPVETVYTAIGDEPEKYGNITDGVFEEIGLVSITGNGIFSITVNSEIYYSTYSIGG